MACQRAGRRARATTLQREACRRITGPGDGASVPSLLLARDGTYRMPMSLARAIASTRFLAPSFCIADCRYALTVFGASSK